MIQSWHFKTIGLPRVLRDLGIHITAFSKDIPRTCVRTEPVSNAATMVFGVGSKWTFAAPGSEPFRSSAIYAGVSTKPQRTTSEDQGTCLEASLPPWLASELFARDIVSTPSCLSVMDEFGPAGKSLVEEVSNSATVQEAAETLIRFLCEKTRDTRLHTRSEILWAWKRLSAQATSASVRELASDIGWSERYFSSRYKESIGCSPTRTAKLARFTTAYQLLVKEHLSLVDVSTLAGYYDQSHMIRDFHEFAGLTPKSVREQEADHLISSAQPFQ